MKKLETFTGGHPFQLDDVRLLQDAYTELFAMFASHGSQDGTPRLVTGCKVTGTAPSRTVSAGWVWWNSQFYYVPAATISGTDTYIIGNPTGEVLPPSPVVYANATTQNCHKNYKMTLASTNTAGNVLVIYIANGSTSILPMWGTEPWANFGSFSSGYGDNGAIYHSGGYRKVSTGMVELRGSVKNTVASPGSTIVTTLPTGFRPAKTVRFTTSTASSPLYVEISTLGEVIIFPALTVINTPVNLDGIRFEYAR